MPARGAVTPGARQAGAVADSEQRVEVEGRRLVLRNLDKVLYPATGTTKAEVLSYVSTVAPALLGQLAHRPVTRKRWVDGVLGPSFFEKNLPRGAPEWLDRVRLPAPGSTKDRELITYPLLGDLAALVWVTNLAALELHVPQWTVGPRGAVRPPDRLVVDLDPGEGAGLPECARVALAVRCVLAEDGLAAFPVTSGSKGMQLYAAVSGEQDAELVRGYAQRVARRLERELPDLVVSRMTKALRPGKVLIDWSQNTAAKTTICPYSLRGRERPTAAAPLTWAEVEAGPVQLDLHQVMDRLATDGDLLAGLAEPGPRLPG